MMFENAIKMRKVGFLYIEQNRNNESNLAMG